MKKVLCLLLVLIMATMFFGCGDTSNDSPTPVEIDNGYVNAYVVDGVAEYSFTIAKAGLFEFYPGPAKDDESDFDGHFEIHNAEGEKVMPELFIHSTEWISRKAFLTEGDYTLKLYDSPTKKTKCKIETVYQNDDMLVNPEGEVQFPKTVGFTNDSLNTISVKIEFDESKPDEKLYITPIGTGTYYDCQQTLDIKVTNEKGETIVDEELCEDFFYYEMNAKNGDLNITITPHDSCYITFEKR